MSSSSTTTAKHARAHALLLLQKLLSLRDSASPLTLVLDTLEQSGKPILREFMSIAQVFKSKIIYISFTTLRRPHNVDVFIRARGKTLESLHTEIISHYPTDSRKTLVIVDELNPLSSSIPTDLASFLSSLITRPSVSLVGLYHTDVPLSLSSSLPINTSYYAPDPLTILSHLATAILRTTNLHHALERRRAQNRSLREPEFGLDEGKEGVLLGLGLRNGKIAAAESARYGADKTQPQGLVLEMELRRRSGRSVAETFVFVPSSVPKDGALAKAQARTATARDISSSSKLYLLSDHPAFRDPSDAASIPEGSHEEDTELSSTFNLGLTEKQRRDREGVVLPYFDAQQVAWNDPDLTVSAGEGHRILYEMTREDDFDEEEDEI